MMWYVIQSAMALSVMFVAYLLLLRRESFFRLNRALLLSILLASMVFPLLHFSLPSAVSAPVGMALLPAYEVLSPSAAAHHQAPQNALAADWHQVLLIAYLLGVVVTLAYKMLQLVLLRRAIHSHVLWSEQRSGATIYCHAGSESPYSWMRSVVISVADYEKNPREILLHEMAHVSHHHSCDILLLGVVQVVQWFNPMAWLMSSALSEVHEYEADDAVLRSGVSARDYKLLLVRKAVAGTNYQFVNGFNHSILTKRFKMMMCKKSNPWRSLWVVAVAAVGMVSVGAFATVKNASPLTALGAEVVASPDGDDVKQFVEQLPEFNGDMFRFMAMNMKYPVEAAKLGVQKRVHVRFIVNTDGSVSDVEVFDPKQKTADRETAVTDNASDDDKQTAKDKKAMAKAMKALDAEAVRVVKAMPKWKPGKDKGEVVRVQMVVPIQFRLK